MPSDYELAKTWWPGVRKEILIEQITLLETKAGEKRIKLGVKMPLGDGRLVGMPSWIGDSYDVIAKEDSLLTSDKWGHTIKEMTLNIFRTDDGQKVSQLCSAPLMAAFQLKRDPQSDDDEEVSELNLHFVIYVVASHKLWSWLYEVRGLSIYVRFETTQKELPLGEVDDKQMKLGENKDAFEDERQEATSPEHDDEFARIN